MFHITYIKTAKHSKIIHSMYWKYILTKLIYNKNIYFQLSFIIFTQLNKNVQQFWFFLYSIWNMRLYFKLVSKFWEYFFLQIWKILYFIVKAFRKRNDWMQAKKVFSTNPVRSLKMTSDSLSIIPNKFDTFEVSVSESSRLMK